MCVNEAKSKANVMIEKHSHLQENFQTDDVIELYLHNKNKAYEDRKKQVTKAVTKRLSIFKTPTRL